MKNVQLVRLDHAIEEAIAHHPEYMDALVQDNWARVADLVHRLVGRTLVAVPVSVDELQWGGYFVVDEGTRERSLTLPTQGSRGGDTRREWQGSLSNWRADRRRSGG